MVFANILEGCANFVKGISLPDVKCQHCDRAEFT